MKKNVFLTQKGDVSGSCNSISILFDDAIPCSVICSYKIKIQHCCKWMAFLEFNV